jgi:hypothetical protein
MLERYRDKQYLRLHTDTAFGSAILRPHRLTLISCPLPSCPRKISLVLSKSSLYYITAILVPLQLYNILLSMHVKL